MSYATLEPDLLFMKETNDDVLNNDGVPYTDNQWQTLYITTAKDIMRIDLFDSTNATTDSDLDDLVADFEPKLKVALGSLMLSLAYKKESKSLESLSWTRHLIYTSDYIDCKSAFTTMKTDTFGSTQQVPVG